MKLHILLLLVVAITSQTTGINWNSASDGVWAMGCDFKNIELSNQQVPGPQCQVHVWLPRVAPTMLGITTWVALAG